MNVDWPHVQDYTKSCPKCKEQYYGPKRSPSCWACYSPQEKEAWEDQHVD